MADRKRTLRRAAILSVAVVLGLGLLAGRTVFSRISNARTLEAQVAERNKQYVRVTQPRSGAKAQTVVLPGTLQGYVQAPISARASGYLKKWTRDIGSRVKQGELLAEIETPEIDQQLSQAIAARQQAASSLTLATSTLERWEALRKRDAVSQQELEEKRSADAQAKANLAAADANVERLRQMKGFNRVVAPFAGVITRRNVDVGDLIDAGGGAGRALFVLAQTDPLRVYVNVPQSYAHLVKPGQQVAVTQQELRGESFKGEIVRTAGAIDAQTRTMQVEVMLANKERKLMPGAYVQVSLPLEGTGALTVPTNVLLLRGEGPRVAAVGADGKVQLRAVKIGRNYGQMIELLDGVGPNDNLVLNPPDSLNDGDPVIISEK
ncbi:MAG: efflux RND transporter periplasmic adaptor subunit [Burkholderiales bacterium]